MNRVTWHVEQPEEIHFPYALKVSDNFVAFGKVQYGTVRVRSLTKHRSCLRHLTGVQYRAGRIIPTEADGTRR